VASTVKRLRRMKKKPQPKRIKKKVTVMGLLNEVSAEAVPLQPSSCNCQCPHSAGAQSGECPSQLC
jgi:hypothetical protein